MRRSTRPENLDTELNLVPIIDCFVMLICFLLFTAAFTQLVYLETKITQNTIAAMTQSRSELDKFHLTVTLKDDGYEFKLEGAATDRRTFTIAKVNGEYDYAKLHAQLIQLKTQYPDRYSIDVAVSAKNGSAIKYDYVLKTIDSVRHLTDQEFAQVRVAGKKAQSLNLTDHELQINVDEVMLKLGESLVSNRTSANADQKALFPDIALTGLY